MARNWRIPRPQLAAAAAAAAAVGVALVARGGGGGTASVVPTPSRPADVFAVLEAGFYRSAAMRCRDFEVRIAPGGGGGRHALSDYVVDFRREAPASGLALRGRLTRRASDKTAAPSVLELMVDAHGAVGPWRQRAGFTPRLRRLALVEDPDVAERVFRCDGLVLEESAGDGDDQPAVRLALDTSRAYNWIRFAGYLDWARHLLSVIRRAAPPVREAPRLVADLGGGSGWMSVLLKAHLGQEHEVLCTDVAAEALELAGSDARTNGLDITLAQGDLFEPLQRRTGPWPDFVFFNPPQILGEAGEWRGSPDVSLLTPQGEATFFHSRFCREAELAPGGVAWLGVNWELIPAVVQECCGLGWDVVLPEALRDLITAPSALLELRRPQPAQDQEDCVRVAMSSAEAAAEYQARAIGARDDAERVRSYRRAAERGVAAGEANLGIAYAMGRGVAADEMAAAEWLRRAAAQGHEDAQVQLGRLLASQGEDGCEEALGLFRVAAEHGNARAQANLGFMYMAAQGVPQNMTEALRWLSRAAERGDARALATLGDCSANGLGVPRDYAVALEWYRRAAERGDVVAQTSLGLMYAEGRGMMFADSEAAVAWFTRAAEQGGLSAQLNLGAMHEAGGDGEAAAAWYRRAATQGSAEAAGRLAALCLGGELGEEGGAEAEGLCWLRVALGQEDPGAQELLANIEAAAADEDPEAKDILARLAATAAGSCGGDGERGGAAAMPAPLAGGAAPSRPGGARTPGIARGVAPRVGWRV